jgi:ParB-like chromosome segregation protein Spo0J
MAFQYQLLPNLTKEEYEILKADIAQHGVLVPIEFDENQNVLDGHHRLQICEELGIKNYPSIVRIGMSEDEKKEHILLINLARRHLNAEQRRQAILNVKLETGWSNRRIAELFGVSHVTVMSDLSTGKFLPVDLPDKTIGKDGKARPAHRPAVMNKDSRDEQRTFDALANLGAEDIQEDILDSKEVKFIAKEKMKEDKRKEYANKGETIELPDTCSVITGDFREIMAGMPDNSIDLIFTDPPYDEETIPLYGELARLANEKLKPGGSLLVYAGNYALPRYFELMTPHLRYWWTIAMMHSGGNARLIGKNIMVGWKPILWFVKDKRCNEEFVTDLIKSNAPSKDEHEWQQDILEANITLNI